MLHQGQWPVCALCICKAAARWAGSPRLLLAWMASHPHRFSLRQHNLTILRQRHRKCITPSILTIFSGILAAFEVPFLKCLRLTPQEYKKNRLFLKRRHPDQVNVYNYFLFIRCQQDYRVRHLSACCDKGFPQGSKHHSSL